MAVSDWFFGTCGRSHIGIYVCSRCGYELVRSSFEKSFVLQSPSLQGLLPLPVTVAAAKGQSKTGKDNKKAIISSVPFDSSSMLQDFTKNANLERFFHKNSLVKRILDTGQGNKTLDQFEVSCGKCGNILGSLKAVSSAQNRFSIKQGTVDLTFRTT